MPEIHDNAVIQRLDAVIALLTKIAKEGKEHEPRQRKRLLRVKDVAMYLGKSVGQVRRLIQVGEIPRVTGRNSNGAHAPWLVDVEDCDQWILRNKT